MIAFSLQLSVSLAVLVAQVDAGYRRAMIEDAMFISLELSGDIQG